jgi:DNA-binding IclR family transcriptional regulator
MKEFIIDGWGGMPSSSYVQSVVKALDILHAISSSESGMSLNDLSEAFGMKKTTVHNLVRTLRFRNYLTKDSGNTYQLGSAVNELLTGLHRKDNMKLASELIRELFGRLPDCSLTFSELCGTEIYCRLRMRSDKPGLLQRPVSITFQPYNSATGICFQAFYEEYHLLVLDKCPFNEYATRRWKSLSQFEKVLTEARKKGYHLEKGNKPGIRVTFPAGENLVFGVDVFDPNAIKVDELIEEARKTAEKIERNGKSQK